MATLVVLQSGEAKPYRLLDGETTLGRLPTCTIQLQSNMVSRLHAKVSLADGKAYIEDNGSGNGTFLNGQRVEARTELKHDDRIKLGPILVRYEAEVSAGSDWKKPGSPGERPLARTPEFSDDFLTEDDDPTNTNIVDSVVTGSGFGVLNVQPEKKLKGVIDITLSLAGTVDPKQMLPKMVDTLFEIFPHADRASILVKNPHNGKMLPAHQRHRREGEDSTVKLSRTILNKVIEEKSGVLSADAASDDQFQASESIANLSIRSLMCVPMLDLNQEVLGVINIDTLNPFQKFTRDDLDLLQAVAGQAAITFENARLLQSYLEKMKQDSEMEIARKVQRALLPEFLPAVDGWQFFASYDSAQAVGGDYYDAFMLGEDKICLSFGDVAGKGVPGALIMSRIASCVQNIVPFLNDAGDAIHAINKHMCSNMVEGRFVTYVLVIIDLTTNEMTLANAGHMSPIIRHADGKTEEFPDETIGIPIGIMEDYPYDVVSHSIKPGDTVVIVTDGVDEAMNPNGDLYGKDRVVKFVSEGSPDARELGEALLADVRLHADGRPQNDDITIMTFGRDA